MSLGMSHVTIKGKPVSLYGTRLGLGEKVPDFVLVNTALRNRQMCHYLGRPLLMNIVPSIDTSVCAKSAQRFDALAEAHLGVSMILISGDLSFAQKRFVEVVKIAHLIPLSMMRSRDFARDYGLLIVDGPLAGLTTRAVCVIDGKGILRYQEIVAEITREPDYEAAISVLTSLETEGAA